MPSMVTILQLPVRNYSASMDLTLPSEACGKKVLLTVYWFWAETQIPKNQPVQ